jgi:hypothetical protein
MMNKALRSRLAHVASVLRLQQEQESAGKAGLLPFKIIRYNDDEQIIYETPEEKMKALLPGEERHILYLHCNEEVATFHQEVMQQLRKDGYL